MMDSIHPPVRNRVEMVIGRDDRQPVTDTLSYPWRCICALQITAADQTLWSGTGWLAGPRLVVTAGHCVYMHEHGGWADVINVAPGANGEIRPYGSSQVTEMLSVEGWIQGQRQTHDYGALILPESDDYARTLGYFGIGAFSDEELREQALNISGYPADKEPAQSLWTHARHVTAFEPELLHYDADTAGGQSGCPAWVWWEGTAVCAGIHTNGSSERNSATRLNANVLGTIDEWLVEATR